MITHELTNKVCQFMHNSVVTQWNAIKRILRYWKSSLNLGLHLQPTLSFPINGFSDCYLAACPNDCRSTIGYRIFLGPNLISWSSKKRVVARQEIRISICSYWTVERVWIQQGLYNQNIQLPLPLVWWRDNIGAIYLAMNPVFYAWTKHLKIDIHLVLEKVAPKDLYIWFISIVDQVTNIMTKGLLSPIFSVSRSELNVASSNFRLRGCVHNHQK